MKIFRRQLIYVRVHQDHFIARVVGGDRTIRRQCHALGNRAGPIKDFSSIRPLLKAIFSELLPGFSLVKPWGILHFDPVEYPVTKEELAGFQKAAMRSGVSFCFLSTWEQRHEDKDLLEMFKQGRPTVHLQPSRFDAWLDFQIASAKPRLGADIATGSLINFLDEFSHDMQQRT